MSTLKSDPKLGDLDEECRRLLDAEPDNNCKVPAELTRKHKLFRLLIQFLTWLSIAALTEITGPVIPELVVQTNSDYEDMLQAISMRGAGHIVGGILGGIFIDRLFYHIDLVCAITAAMFTLLGVAAAYVTSIEVMFIVLFVQGAVETVLGMAGYRIVFVSFKERAAAACNVILFGYYLGGVLGPAVVEPFLEGSYTEIHLSITGNKTANMSTNENIESSFTEYPANFVKAYWIISSFGMLVTLLNICLHIHSRHIGVNLAQYINVTSKQSFRQQASPRSCSPSHPVIAALFLVMLFFHIGCLFAMARVYSKVIFSYDREGPGLSVADSSSMTSSFFLSNLCGILVFLIPTSFIHIKYILQLQASMLLGVCILLSISYTNVTALWVLFLGMGFFRGPLVASGIGMVNNYIELTSLAQMVPQIGAAVADVVVMHLVGSSYKHYGPYSIWLHAVAIASVVFIVATSMQILGYFHGGRFDKSS